ncbi:MAG: methyl-accepting chemotaxis protein [Candidatus Kapaibacterium sp.]
MIILVTVAVISVGATGYTAITSSTEGIEEAVFRQLTTVTDTKKAQTENYFSNLKKQITTFSQNTTVISAMTEFSESARQIAGNTAASEEQIAAFRQGLLEYYKSDFMPSLDKNSERQYQLQDFLPDNYLASYLQYNYIILNQHPTGEKHKLMRASDESMYSDVHAKYHTELTNYLETFGYYDIFLVDNQSGNIIYSVYKEIDFATNLLEGPYASSKLGEAFRSARESENPDDVILTDFGPYLPSYSLPASFIASPIFRGGRNIGTIIFQIKPDGLNRMLSANFNWEGIGLGETGEAFIVGKDMYMRSDDRSLLEKRKGYYENMKSEGIDPATVERIRRQNTTILNLKLENEAIQAAVSGKTGEMMATGVLGEKMLYSYTPLKIEGLDWYMIAKKADKEALVSVASMQMIILIVAGIIILLVIGISIIFSKTFSTATNRLIEISRKIGAGNFDIQINKDNNTEFGIVEQEYGKVVNELDNLTSEIGRLTDAASRGNLDVRGEASKFSGEYKDIVEGFNGTLDKIIQPFNLSAEYIDRISKGDLPERITDEYHGDFNEIKNNLNQCIDSIQLMLDDVRDLTRASVEGDILKRIETDRHNGDYKTLVSGINSLQDAVRNILDQVPAPIMIIDKDFNIKFINTAGAGLDNKTAEQLRNTKCFDHFKTSDCQTENCACYKSIKTQKNAASATDAHPGNYDLEIEYTANPVFDEEGNIAGAIEIVIDQTKIKQAMRSIEKVSRFQEEQSEQLTAALSKMAEGDLSFDLESESGDEDTREAAEIFSKINDAVNRSRGAIRGLADEVNTLVEAALEGNLDKRADDAGQLGEYRKIISGVNKTLDAILDPIGEAVEVLKQMSEGNLSVKVEGDYKGDHAIIKNALNQTIDLMPFKEAIRVLEKFADGDLTIHMTGEYKGDSLKMKEALNDTINSINEILAQVKLTVDEVTRGAMQVSDASTSLSQGATEQAASLEEITSSMTQIGSQTRHTAENANLANTLTRDARDSAERGNKEMKELNDAMNEISHSSQDISRIMKVIDEIAFQTNLLALNAAVEAARAGRHGKGFAVVAEEVRNLAARSAKAAKETADLIENSLKTVENGIQLANRTAEVLEEIGKGSVKSADIVSEIATLSNEQAQAIAQINEGLTQIDKVTQTNTASAEESASAAEELSGQSSNLNQMIARFKIDEISDYELDEGFAEERYSERRLDGGNDRNRRQLEGHTKKVRNKQNVDKY